MTLIDCSMCHGSGRFEYNTELGRAWGECAACHGTGKEPE